MMKIQKCDFLCLQLRAQIQMVGKLSLLMRKISLQNWSDRIAFKSQWDSRVFLLINSYFALSIAGILTVF